MTEEPTHSDELAERIVADPMQAVRFFYETYSVLKALHKEADWDSPYYDDAVKLWDELGDWMYP